MAYRLEPEIRWQRGKRIRQFDVEQDRIRANRRANRLGDHARNCNNMRFENATCRWQKNESNRAILEPFGIVESSAGTRSRSNSDTMPPVEEKSCRAKENPSVRGDC